MIHFVYSLSLSTKQQIGALQFPKFDCIVDVAKLCRCRLGNDSYYKLYVLVKSLHVPAFSQFSRQLALNQKVLEWPAAADSGYYRHKCRSLPSPD